MESEMAVFEPGSAGLEAATLSSKPSHLIKLSFKIKAKSHECYKHGYSQIEEAK